MRFFILFPAFLFWSSLIIAQVSQVPGSLDGTFNAGSGANGPVYAIEVDNQNRIYVGGDFSQFNGVNKRALVRLLPNGSIDTSFQTVISNLGVIWDIDIRPEGKLYVCGQFSGVNSSPTSGIAKLNMDGSLDTSFSNSHGPNDFIRSMAFDQNSRIIIGGDFTLYDSINVVRIARLLENGRIDTSFHTGLGADKMIHFVTTDGSGKILVGGIFDTFSGSPIKKLVRLLSNGNIDSTFNHNLNLNNIVRWINILPNGQLLVSGYFSQAGQTPASKVIRLSPNGLLDPTFSVGAGATTPVYTGLLQKNGKYVISGNFSSFNNKPYKNVTRLLPSGQTDSIFNISGGPNSAVQALALDSSGNILIGGFFTSYNNVPQGRISRIFGDKILTVSNPNLVTGRVYQDKNANCIFDSNDLAMRNRIVVANPGPFFGMTDATGHYSISVDSGSYSVKQLRTPFQGLIESAPCSPLVLETFNLNFGSNTGDTVSGVNFANRIFECSFLKVSVSSIRRRRCFRNTSFVQVCNKGVSPSPSNTKINVLLPQYLNFISSAHNFSFDDSDSSYHLEIGSILPNECKTYQFIDSVSCVPGIMGLDQCIQVWVTPGNNCNPPNSLWDGSDLSVFGNCSNLDPIFLVKNTGYPMASKREYRVFLDSLLIYSDSIIVGGNDSLLVEPILSSNNGGTFRFEVDQSVGHPFSTFAASSVSCGPAQPVNSSTFFGVNENPVYDINCMEVRDSYDPNDKLVKPKGQTQDGNVLPGRYFDYKIRFQNTGNDTAYKVVIVDTLSPVFDLSTFEIGPGSHKFTYSVSGQVSPVIKFVFDQIMLPDSITDPIGSNGFVSFRIKANQGLPLGTQIKNFADIYFDFNDPVRTNTTVNTLFLPQVIPGVVDSVSVVTFVKPRNLANGEHLTIFPNPTSGKFSFESSTEVKIAVFSITGTKIIEIQDNTKFGNINLQNFPKGIYFIKASFESGQIVKKLVLQ